MIGLLMCLSFWFYILGGTPSASSGLKLKMVRGDAQKELLEPPIRQKDSWENATVLISNRPGGYKVSKISRMPLD